MKKIFGILIMVGLLLTSFIFTGCSSNANSNNTNSSKSKVIAVFSGSYSDNLGTTTTTVTFYENGDYVAHYKNDMLDLDGEAGFYTGDPTKDGEITITRTKEAAWNLSLLGSLFSAKKTTNEDCPLEDLPEKNWEIETYNIIDGKVLAGDEEDGYYTLTRK